MQNTFTNALKEATSVKRTENNALTYDTSLSYVLDMFALGGAYRKRTQDDVQSLFLKAFSEDPVLATKCLFYIRDVRGGQGEREFFRSALPMLISNINPEQKNNLIQLIPRYGRWDDMFGSYDHPEVKSLIYRQLYNDIANMKEGNSISLLAKWLPSINTSSEDSRNLAKQIAKDLGMKHSTYRKILSSLRHHLDVVERKMSANQWEDINLETIPSQAKLMYKKALMNHIPNEVLEHMQKVRSGEEKTNTGTLYPYQILKKVYYPSFDDDLNDDYYDMMWENLPDYVPKDQKAIVVADTSGSMYGDPILVALSLALYFAERNTGAFANKFITFSVNPKFQEIPTVGTLVQKAHSMAKADWMGNTDIDKVFDLILRAAKVSKPEDVPTTIYIVSDMEWDECVREDSTNFEYAKEKFNEAGLELPNLVFWNVDARNDTIPVRQGEQGVTLVSGCSPVIFKQAITRTTPFDFMMQVLSEERYKPIEALFE